MNTPAKGFGQYRPIAIYGAPEPPRHTLWRSWREFDNQGGFYTPPLHYSEEHGGWTVFGHQPVPQWREIPEPAFPLFQV